MARSSAVPVVVFDLGGTWSRSGVLDGREVVGLERTPTSTVLGGVRAGDEARRRIISWLAETFDRISGATRVARCAVSLGAAMDGRTGEVVGAAPLFGAERFSWWPEKELRLARPEVAWTVVNDVSALAYALLHNDDVNQAGTAAAVTVSTGIAYRTIDLATGHIPYDRDNGLQGEIGHLPSRMDWEGRPVTALCDCGARDHVSAFASGAAVERFLREIRSPRWGVPDGTVETFAASVHNGHAGARAVLDAVTMPMAEVVLAQACLNPRVEHTVFTGGVVDGLGEHYLASLTGNLGRLGLYGVSDRDPGYFARRLRTGQADRLDALRGAGIHARGFRQGGACTA
ncbi:hypothetical protein UK23_06150 [Lentzea aerocolonigenes]|uniref:ROK family protein n=1 Tax=Lentzea aerocolonigenes TaxID=68170 RepID=A0A0F0HBJ8_LENAE|nr:hypothetical protein UK23_06150 [Lentzea aerocolonigenes]